MKKIKIVINKKKIFEEADITNVNKDKRCKMLRLNT